MMDKNAYVYIHSNYKGELKDERFVSFLLTKLSDTIIAEFDKFLDHIRISINQIKAFVFFPNDSENLERVESNPLTLPDFKFIKDIEEKCTTGVMREESEMTPLSMTKEDIESIPENEVINPIKTMSENSAIEVTDEQKIEEDSYNSKAEKSAEFRKSSEINIEESKENSGAKDKKIIDKSNMNKGKIYR